MRFGRMFGMTILILIAIITLCSPLTAHAQGLAMHGQPKYGPDFTHLDYANPNAPKGGTMKQSAIGTFDSLNPYALKGKAAQGLNLFYDRLMRRVWDEPFTMYPLIAKRVDVAEDRSSVTFHLNSEARFHDGAPITADDVLFSFETLKEHGRPNMRRIYKLIKNIEKKDDLTVHFEFGEGHDQETVMIIAMMPVLSKSWWQDKEFDSTILEVPVSNGPYKIKSFEAGRQIIYERDPHYWAKDLSVNAGHYNFDQVVFDYYRDDTVAFESFKAGDTDLRREWDVARWMTGYNFPVVSKGDVYIEALSHSRPERVRSLIFNTRRPPFDDIRIREALNYVLDFNWINENLFHGQYKRINSYFPNSELAASKKPTPEEIALLEPFRYQLSPEIFGPLWHPPIAKSQIDTRKNIKRADTLLKQAGWSVQKGKRIHDETGKPFTFEILLGAPEDEKLALSFVRSLKRLGIDANVRVMDTAAFRGRLNDYDFDMVLYHWQNSLSPGTEQMLYWSCEAAKQPAQWNFPGICDPAVDALAQGIANAKTRKNLVTYARALDRVLVHGKYTIPLYYAGQDFVAYRNHINHPQQTPLYGMVVETWWADK